MKELSEEYDAIYGSSSGWPLHIYSEDNEDIEYGV